MCCQLGFDQVGYQGAFARYADVFVRHMESKDNPPVQGYLCCDHICSLNMGFKSSSEAGALNKAMDVYFV